MKGTKHLIGACAVAAISAHASAQLTEFTDQAAFLAASGPMTEIDFSEFPVGTVLTNQFAPLEINFTDADDTIFSNVAFLNGVGLQGSGDIVVSYSTPRFAVGCSYPGGLRLELFNGNIPVGVSQDFGGAGTGFFGGVVSVQPFDRLVISDWVDSFVFIGTLLVESTPAPVGFCFGDDPQPNCPCGNVGSPGEGCANSTGAGAILTPGGSAQVGLDDLSFTAAQLVPGQSALLFAGEIGLTQGAVLSFGDGKLCVGGPIRRLSVTVPDAQGAASWGPGLRAAGGWAAGDVRYFQVWYRDTVGLPCGAFFNTSQGIEVAFVP